MKYSQQAAKDSVKVFFPAHEAWIVRLHELMQMAIVDNFCFPERYENHKNYNLAIDVIKECLCELKTNGFVNYGEENPFN